MVLERLVVPEVQKVSGSLERKICAVGLTRLICESPICFTGGIHPPIEPKKKDLFHGGDLLSLSERLVHE